MGGWPGCGQAAKDAGIPKQSWILPLGSGDEGSYGLTASRLPLLLSSQDNRSLD